jgi:protein-S-isoprenylcysteine O-methyltransferase Ste14
LTTLINSRHLVSRGAFLLQTSAFIRYGEACFRYRGLMLPAAVLLMLIPSLPLSANAVVQSWWGLGVALAGQIIRVGTIGLEYIIRGGKDHHVYAEKLVTSGLYAHVRNPMYLGNAFLLAGLAVASNSLVFAVGGVLLGVAVHVGIIGAEEHFLRRRFGSEYDAYCARVPRLIPRFEGLVKTFAAADRFNWGRVIDKEYMAPVDWMSAAAVISLVALWRADQLEVSPPLLVLIAVVVLLRLVLWQLQRVRSGFCKKDMKRSK